MWAVDAGWCYAVTLAALREWDSKLKDDDKLNALILSDSFGNILLANEITCAFPIRPPQSHTRLSAQQGLFLCPGNTKLTFEENLQDGTPAGRLREHVTKYLLPRRLRREILTDLQRMNITRVSPFPGLDGLAVSLRVARSIGSWPPVYW